MNLMFWFYPTLGLSAIMLGLIWIVDYMEEKLAIEEDRTVAEDLKTFY